MKTWREIDCLVEENTPCSIKDRKGKLWNKEMILKNSIQMLQKAHRFNEESNMLNVVERTEPTLRSVDLPYMISPEFL